MVEASEGGHGKARKRMAAKAVTGQMATKVKATIHLSGEADKRLSVHAAMMEMDRSALVEKLINDHLRQYVVSDRGGAGDWSHYGNDCKAIMLAFMALPAPSAKPRAAASLSTLSGDRCRPRQDRSLVFLVRPHFN
jgi:hypothetical protein